MHPDQIKALFDQQASSYDVQWAQTAPIKQCLYFLLESFFAPLPQQAHILCVGVGTGQEMAWLAQQHPGWQFTAVEPSGAMLEQCRKRAERDGFSARCQFHEGYLDSLPAAPAFDAATSFLVSQFILDTSERTAFFEQIASRLRAGGLLASADLAADQQSAEYDVMLQAWMQMMAGANITPDTLNRMRHAYAHDVAVLPPAQVASLIQAAGFETPALFFQAGLIHAWCAQRAA